MNIVYGHICSNCRTFVPEGKELFVNVSTYKCVNCYSDYIKHGWGIHSKVERRMNNGQFYLYDNGRLFRLEEIKNIKL